METDNGKETTSIKINPELWKEAKKYAIDKGITVSDLLEETLREKIKRKV